MKKKATFSTIDVGGSRTALVSGKDVTPILRRRSGCSTGSGGDDRTRRTPREEDAARLITEVPDTTDPGESNTHFVAEEEESLVQGLVEDRPRLPTPPLPLTKVGWDQHGPDRARLPLAQGDGFKEVRVQGGDWELCKSRLGVGDWEEGGRAMPTLNWINLDVCRAVDPLVSAARLSITLSSCLSLGPCRFWVSGSWYTVGRAAPQGPPSPAAPVVYCGEGGAPRPPPSPAAPVVYCGEGSAPRPPPLHEQLLKNALSIFLVFSKLAHAHDLMLVSLCQTESVTRQLGHGKVVSFGDVAHPEIDPILPPPRQFHPRHRHTASISLALVPAAQTPSSQRRRSSVKSVPSGTAQLSLHPERRRTSVPAASHHHVTCAAVARTAAATTSHPPQKRLPPVGGVPTPLLLNGGGLLASSPNVSIAAIKISAAEADEDSLQRSVSEKSRTAMTPRMPSHQPPSAPQRKPAPLNKSALMASSTPNVASIRGGGAYSNVSALCSAVSEGELLDLAILPIFQKLLSERHKSRSGYGASIASCPNISIKCDIVEYL
uniref:Uncharacterized protein n=1 Tax=Timema shepardi TaxID=629360 RepID=A0A7R9G583_TIMSH|nr:unnamed protein product [Timema shepardi]